MAKYRDLILEIIKASSGHMTAEAIYLEAKKLQPSIAVGTVYRNLRLMTEAGEIKRVVMANSPDIFDISTHPHAHLICQKCHTIADFSISNLEEHLQKLTGLEILGYDLNVRYICNICKKKGIG
ncbi:MAG: transcriptional repressor [Chitinispirillaceae bacterium]|nr:transcriptional repressor [Chitinispirillaceae bacterium]